jgi:hypothetical protein
MRHLKWIVGVLVVLSLIALFVCSMQDARRRADSMRVQRGVDAAEGTGLPKATPHWVHCLSAVNNYPGPMSLSDIRAMEQQKRQMHRTGNPLLRERERSEYRDRRSSPGSPL